MFDCWWKQNDWATVWWKKLWQYVKPFSSDTGTLRTDGRTDRRTDLLYEYCSWVCWRAIKTTLRVTVISMRAFYKSVRHLAVAFMGVHYKQNMLHCRTNCRKKSPLHLSTFQRHLKTFLFTCRKSFPDIIADWHFSGLDLLVILN